MTYIMLRFIEKLVIINDWFISIFIGALGKPVRRNIAWLGRRALAANHSMGMFLDYLKLENNSDEGCDVKFVIKKSKIDKKMESFEQLSMTEDKLSYYMDYGLNDDVEDDDIDTIDISYKNKGNKYVKYTKIIVNDINNNGDDYKISGDFYSSSDEIFDELEDVRLTFHLNNFVHKRSWQQHYGRAWIKLAHHHN